jgi:very-short-patch-repair endonuclease
MTGVTGGTGYIATFNREYLPFEEARAFVHTLDIKTQAEWNAYCKSGEKPDTIPSNPGKVYKGNWLGLGDWLCGVNTQTMIEVAVSSELKRRGTAYVQQKRIGRYRVDFFVEELSLCLECDGCYWHGCEQCGFTNHVKREYDCIRDGFILNREYLIIHLWEHDILNDVKAVIAYALSYPLETRQVSA